MTPGVPFPLGVWTEQGRIHAAIEYRGEKALYMRLFDLKDRGKKLDLPFPMDKGLGYVYAMTIEGIDPHSYGYCFLAGGQEFMDPYAVRTAGNEKWGDNKAIALFPRKREEAAGLRLLPYASLIEGESTFGAHSNEIRRPYNETILYLIHVRGFTKHKSSGVKHPGTFEGVAEKIPYIKSLGVNAVELMPPYDFNEVMPEPVYLTEAEAQEGMKSGAVKKRRINYWGFTGGNYFTPKNSYAAGGDGPASFKAMVEAFHRADIEVIVDFYFAPEACASFVLFCLYHWLLIYGVDGFRVMGEKVPVGMIMSDPYLSKTKIFFENAPEGDALTHSNKNIAVINRAYQTDMRKFLKGDEDMLHPFTFHLLEHPEEYSLINFMASYDGLCMYDMVCYDQKHNEANGENNRDGTDYNYSWNCGVEGPTKRKAINALRMEQLRNAFTFLMLSQGVPEIKAGDEFLHSQKGNNNAYCQDNSITYLNWENVEKYSEMVEFVRKLISFRKAHPVFHSREKKRMMDSLSCGYPDISFHGDQAWAPRFDNFFRHIGVLFAGAYEKNGEGVCDGDFYMASNMHWQSRRFALPNPPAGKQWVQAFSTLTGFKNERRPIEGSSFLVNCRSIRVLMTVEKGPDFAAAPDRDA